MIVQLHDQVLGHAASRQLDKAGWKLDESDLQDEAESAVPAGPSDVDDFPVRLETFVAALRGRRPVAAEWEGNSPRDVVFSNSDLLYGGWQEMTFRVREAGLSAGEGIDERVQAYGQVWPLDQPEVRAQLAWIIVYGLVPDAVHGGTPCTKLCRIGKHDPTEAEPLVALWKAICLHQEAVGRLASNENPTGSDLVRVGGWAKAFGTPDTVVEPWRYYTSHGCQLHMVYPGVDNPGAPMHKGQDWMANFSLERMVLWCRKPSHALPRSSVSLVLRD
jgi:hypothetical protein